MADLSQYTDEQLDAMLEKSQPPKPDLSQYSDAELDAMLKKQGDGVLAELTGINKGDDVPEWGRKSPNLYAAAATAAKNLPVLAALAGKRPVVSALTAGGLNAAGDAIERSIHGKSTNAEQAFKDFRAGATLDAAGQGLGRFLKAGADSIVHSSPVQGMANFVKDVLPDKLTNSMANKAYQSAMKFSTSPNVLTPTDRAMITRTGMEGGYLPDESSWLRLKDAVKTNSAQVDDIINTATQAGDTIPAADVLKRANIGELLDRGQSVRGVAPEYTGSVDDITTTFMKGEKIAPYTPNDINASKRQLYQTLEDAYRNNTLSQPNMQTKKQLAAGLKSELEARYPEIAKLNAKSKELLDLSDHLARSIGRVSNRDIIGLGDKVVLDSVASIPTESIGAAGKGLFATALSMLDRPMPKAKLAIALYKANTGKTLPISQWKKGLKYIGEAAPQTIEAAVLGNYGKPEE